MKIIFRLNPYCSEEFSVECRKWSGGARVRKSYRKYFVYGTEESSERLKVCRKKIVGSDGVGRLRYKGKTKIMLKMEKLPTFGALG